MNRLLPALLIFLVLLQPAAAPAEARIRAIALAPTAEDVNVLIDGEEVHVALAFGQASAFTQVAAGAHTVVLYSEEAAAEVARLENLPLADGRDYSVILHDAVPPAAVFPVFHDNAPTTPGGIRLRGFHLVGGLGRMDLVRMSGAEAVEVLFKEMEPGVASLYEERQRADVTRLGIDVGGDGSVEHAYSLPALPGAPLLDVFVAREATHPFLLLVSRDGPTLRVERDDTTIPTPTPTPTPIPEPEVASWSFEAGAEGWTFASPPGFAISTGEAREGALAITASDNTNTFGFWESPPTEIPVGDGAPHIVAARIRSDRDSRADAPDFRIRVSSADFSITETFAVSSTGAGELSPDSEFRAYRHVVQGALTGGSIRVSFDILAFGAENPADGALLLDQLDIHRLDPQRLTDAQELARYDFRNGRANSFSARTAPPFTIPNFFVHPRGLAIDAPGGDDSETFFGSWGRETPITIAPGRLLGVVVNVVSLVPPEQVAELPAFRLRLNDSGLQASSILNAESISADSPLPSGGNAHQYTIFLDWQEAWPERSLILSFDFLSVQGSGNSPAHSLFFELAEVYSWQLVP